MTLLLSKAPVCGSIVLVGTLLFLIGVRVRVRDLEDFVAAKIQEHVPSIM